MNRGKQGSFGLAVQAIQLLKEQKVNVVENKTEVLARLKRNT